MYAIIIGGGRIGATLAQALAQKGHETLVIERSPARCAMLREQLGSVVMRGDGCEAAVLAEAGAERADLVIAVTEGDEDNLIACQVAHHRFHVGRVIARVNNPKHLKLFHVLGVAAVDVVDIIVDGVLQEVAGRDRKPLASLRQGSLDLLSVTIPKTASVVGRRVTDVPLPPGATIAVVLHPEGPPLTPSRHVILAADDQVLAIVRPEDEQAVIEALTR